MTSVFPTLEQQFDYSSRKGALILLTEYASPKRLRRLSETRLTQWLRRRQVRDAARVAARALAAAHGQDIELPGQHVAEMIIAELAASLLQLDQRIQGLDQQIAATSRRHHHAATIESMPGFGPILGAQLLVAAGDLRGYLSAGHVEPREGRLTIPSPSTTSVTSNGSSAASGPRARSDTLCATSTSTAGARPLSSGSTIRPLPTTPSVTRP
jgi:hypothetical protein